MNIENSKPYYTLRVTPKNEKACISESHWDTKELALKAAEPYLERKSLIVTICKVETVFRKCLES